MNFDLDYVSLKSFVNLFVHSAYTCGRLFITDHATLPVLTVDSQECKLTKKLIHFMFLSNTVTDIYILIMHN